VTVAVTQSKLCIIFRANVFLYISYFWASILLLI
jgi:hypothetical protein